LSQLKIKNLGTITDLKNIHGPFEIFTLIRKKNILSSSSEFCMRLHLVFIKKKR